MRHPDTIDMWGEVLANERKLLRKEYTAKIAVLEARIKELDQHHSLEAKFFEMEHRLDARQLARESKRGSEMIPQSELLAKIEKLQRRIDDLKKVADLDSRFRELAERVANLKKPTASKRVSLSLLTRPSAEERSTGRIARKDQ